MKKHIIAFMLILIMAFVCSLDSWGGCTDCESYGFYSGKMQDFITAKVNKIPGFFVTCGPQGNSTYGYSGCELNFPQSSEPMRAIHSAQNITDILAGMLHEIIPVNMELMTFIFTKEYGNFFIYKIYYNAEFDVFRTVYRFP